ncbi:hypothetical protein H5410_052773 [Solanum commersonii]|uniref:Reverse transcriptase zinc-binding domain-containing protein n=1 Tax=Solanum commersonii TaxID=4109 RepID=A0A9J5X2H4_SOLCO|nr:hypothetical protein H5410_052773 [Solanum commersonii]
MLYGEMSFMTSTVKKPSGVQTSKVVVSPHGVGVWKAIRSLWSLMAGKISLRVGNGRKILFWCDKWLGHGPLKELFPEFFSIATTPNISLESAKGVHGWNITFRRLQHDQELERVVEFFKTLGSFQGFKDTEDSLIWKPTSKGTYLCFLCGAAGENNSHLFIHCPVTGQLWQLFLNMVGIRWSMPATSVDLLKCWNQNDGAVSQKKWWKLVPACIWWTIWKERNYRAFEDKYNFVEKTKMNCIFLFYFWCKESYAEEAESLVDMIGSL